MNDRIAGMLRSTLSAGPTDNTGEINRLRDRFDEALSVLRKARFEKPKPSLWSRILHHGRYVYELPWYVIIGAPGVGKTTLLQELEKRGYNCVPEVARNIIKVQIQSEGDALPWKNRTKYSELMLEKSIKDFLDLKEVSITAFFDRGIPDTYAYNRLINIEITAELEKAANKYRYNRKVFILPPWEEIYTTDNERKQDYEEALLTYRVMKQIYSSLDYELIELPKISVSERADMVISNLSGKK